MPASRFPPSSSNKAAALIIVLAFVVLLTGLGLAYFSSSTTDRQLAHSSYNDTSADLLARSALDIVVGDFKQEIVNGSSPTPVPGNNGSYCSTTTIYIPKDTGSGAAANMIPRRNNVFATIPNLIRRSLRSETALWPDQSVGPAIGSRASAVNSQDNPSANGRYINSTRWNAHYLVPKGNTATTDSSPIPAFTGATPDWVFVTNSGPAVITAPSDAVIGRYAYAVYDEGGLLEINVAGYPAPPTPLPAYASHVGRKGALNWADLAALAPSVGTALGNKVAGFRNYATTAQNNVENLNFSYTNNTQIQSFIDYSLGSPIPGAANDSARIGTTRDFGTVRNDLFASDSRTDQSFTTRAEMIKFFNSAFPNNTAVVKMLQYVGTFSREQNKPSLPLTPTWPFTRVVLPQRFYLANLNCVQNPAPAGCNVQRDFGLQFGAQGLSGSGPCDSQLRWLYVGSGASPCPAVTATPTATPTPTPTPITAATPLSYIPSLPGNLTQLEFFQYINYALFGVTGDDFAHITYTLGIGAALIDMYDVETSLITGLNYSPPIPTPTPTPTAVVPPTPTPTPTACDNPTTNTYLVYGAEQPGSTPPTIRTGIPTGISPPPTPEPLGTPGTDNVPFINQGFRNVGEFGWAYSILNAANDRNSGTSPKYLIDFWQPYNSTSNPDPALLDFFTYNSAPVRSGIVSLNTRQAPVLAAILQKAIYAGTAFVLTPGQATNAANAILNDAFNGTIANPMMSRADIARFGGSVASTVFAGTSVSQDRRDTFARVLSETTQTRTWGLLIDLVAQTGHYKPNATSLESDFVVEGEKRYWLHIAIDRFDGTIVGQQLEEVTE